MRFFSRMVMKKLFFFELDISDLKNHLVLVDMDGTLFADGQQIINPQSEIKLKEMSRDNRVYFCSNKRGNLNRKSDLSRFADIHCLETPFRKPNPKILDYVPNAMKQPIVVIGDKFLTDGLFARNTGARFIKVRRVKAPSDPFPVKISYWLDDWAYRLARLIHYGSF